MNHGSAFWAVALMNIALTAGFVICAIYFNKWWIVLFSIIAGFSLKTRSDGKKGSDHDGE